MEKCDSTKHLVLDVPTRWNYTYIMLETSQVYEKAFERFDIEDSHFREDLRSVAYKSDVPSHEDWENVRKLCQFLKSFYDVTLKVSGTHYVTSHTVVDYIIVIRGLLKGSLTSTDLVNISSAMKGKFDKYFEDVKKMNLLLYFSLVLGPRNKLPYLEIILVDHYGLVEGLKMKEYVLNRMRELYDEYVRLDSPSSTTESCSSSSLLGKRSIPVDSMPTPTDTMRNKLRDKMKTHIVDSIDEFEKFMKESVEEESSKFDILNWWKVNSIRFPILSLMARDVFAIPISTVASESVFSTSGRVLDAFRSSLTSTIAEAIVCTQDWLRTSDNPSVEEDWEGILQLDKELRKVNL